MRTRGSEGNAGAGCLSSEGGRVWGSVVSWHRGGGGCSEECWQECWGSMSLLASEVGFGGMYGNGGGGAVA